MTEETTRVVVITLTVLGAPLIGLLLYQFSQRSSRVKFKGEADEIAAGMAGQSADAKAMLPAILAELNQLQAPAQERHRVARSVSDIVAKTLDDHVTRVKHDLNERYGQLIEEKRRNEVALQRKVTEAVQERKQTMSVMESIAEGLVVVNNQGEVVMMNAAAEKLLAVDRTASTLGRPLMDNLKDDQLVSLVRGSNEDREIVLNAKQDSTRRVLRASNAVITDEDGKAVGMVAVLSDVTKQKEIDQLKSEFVSKVSHELRTPLVAMQHALAILSDGVAGQMTEEQVKFVSLSQRNLERLNHLINDLLDLSKLEARKMELRLATGSMTAIAKGVCESLDAWANSKGLLLTQRFPEPLPPMVFDQGRITQVLTNLIANAIKFTPKQGRITIEGRLTQNGRAMEVSVVDTGIGIAKEDLLKLFNKFQQVGDRAATDVSGTGLGLAIAKEIIELHHGRIWAESDAGRKGAKFAFEIPLTPPTPPGKTA